MEVNNDSLIAFCHVDILIMKRLDTTESVLQVWLTPAPSTISPRTVDCEILSSKSRKGRT